MGEDECGIEPIGAGNHPTGEFASRRVRSSMIPVGVNPIGRGAELVSRRLPILTARRDDPQMQRSPGWHPNAFVPVSRWGAHASDQPGTGLAGRFQRLATSD
jgi:hypothetical protein